MSCTNCDTEQPGFLKRVWNFACSMTAHLANGAKEVPPAEYNQRLRTCGQCPQLDVPTLACIECGCPVRLKARFASEHCPHPDGDRWELAKTTEVFPVIGQHRPPVVTPPPPGHDQFPCPHRGRLIAVMGGGCCGSEIKSPPIPIYLCEKHNQCSPVETNGTRFCGKCPDNPANLPAVNKTTACE